MFIDGFYYYYASLLNHCFNLPLVPTVGVNLSFENVSASNSYQSNCHLLSVNTELRMWLYDDLESEYLFIYLLTNIYTR